MSNESSDAVHIAIVGPCAAGKSTLAQALRARGYAAHQIAQEHSFASAMWKEITDPDILIYLSVTFTESMRRKPLNWTPREFEAQEQRLVHARQHCDIYIDTNDLTPEQVLGRTLQQLEIGHE